jgi:hypothetical protein
MWEILSGKDTSRDLQGLLERDRRAVVEILEGTVPEFVRLRSL